jgi:EAL domain-containing protein (putative c-di-GMP-specific phosphodiesterase class I)
LQKLKSTLKPNLQVVFEITEEEKETKIIMCKNMVDGVKKQGFLITLDDLGKGNSTLPYAIELKPNIVKLDQCFSEDLSKSSKNQLMVEFIINQFGKDTIIILERLENDVDLLAAKNLGIQYAQGFVLGKPQPLDYYLKIAEMS